MSLDNPDTSAHSRITVAWEKLATWALSFIIVLLGIGYNDQKSKIERMESVVLSLQVDKVSKVELREVEMRINNNFDLRMNELISRSASDKQDILSRIDLLLGSRYNDKK